MKIQIRKIAAVLALGSLAVLAGCGGGDDDIGQIIGTSSPQYRTVHANPFIQNVDFGVNGTVRIANVGFKNVSNYFGIDATATTATVSNAGSNSPLASATFNPVNGHRYTALAIVGANGTATNLSIIDDPYDKSILSDKARVRTFNASYNAPNVDVYVTAPNADLTNVAPTMGGAAYGAASPASTQDSIYVDGGTYQIRVTTAGTKNVIFSSQPFSLANNADWLITTLPAGGIGAVTPNNIRVLVAQANGASQTASELPSQ
ncbi:MULTISPECIES: DUF4397 domain-containing protein [Ralstonia]|uniref:DUF4397 domain-containing protein n=1 Tax=Ralstonia mannitolilytica TaxID=105219 RepID=A0AAJ4ZQP9_9RALS|nr:MULTISPECIES: DUF4397 domain-containing protein [Ralstonia]AJW46843.1 hisitidine kinase [Ralstonia mannitolilytica]MBU9577139.1 DUF4397 domain-containing protein [Ralstonia mannitolilytica]PLT17716.1 DUF4397 domain-containing protein [Ralstonia mannitolilytica]QIF10191.1 DUF4397 domain-containing protein [Ralstonia mannitolilytica]CAG2131097.1 hypothetical protein LMG6866_00583 [Ralstonia mannitolilytica]